MVFHYLPGLNLLSIFIKIILLLLHCYMFNSKSIFPYLGPSLKEQNNISSPLFHSVCCSTSVSQFCVVLSHD